MLSEKLTYRLMLLPAFAVLCVFIYFPAIRGLGMAFQNYQLFDLSDTGFNGLANFHAFIFDPHVSFLRIVLNTLMWLAGSLILQLLLGFILALLMREPFWGRWLYAGFVFYAWALSGFAIGLTWAWLFNGQFGVINDVLVKAGIIREQISFLSTPRFAMLSVIIANIWYGIPFFGIMLLAALQSVPKELYESATIDGCSRFHQLFSITIPYVKPTIISTVLLRTMWIVNFPDIIYAMTNGGPANSTNILATQMINKVFKEYNYGQGAAVSFIIMFLLFFYAIFYLKVNNKSEERL
ncbi:MAG: sugar ABC transporter permease [Spirochaetota bacterium]